MIATRARSQIAWRLCYASNTSVTQLRLTGDSNLLGHGLHIFDTLLCSDRDSVLIPRPSDTRQRCAFLSVRRHRRWHSSRSRCLRECR